ncbi:hypothetical protein APHAL10511_006675 [Amanita phalloides]|nr:hypothetical protein APHAL10511_006675 [Amanita phalloides]
MDTSDTPIAPLLNVVFASIFEVFLLCISGYILAGGGVLDKKTQKQINRLNVSLFTPALLFSKVAFFLTPEKLQELWIIPLFFVTVTLTSMTVAFILGTVCRLKKSQRSFAMAAAMFMNSNSLPIALMQSLVVTVPSLKWDKDDNKDIMLGRALTYLVLYSTFGMVIRWSYGVKLLSQADDETCETIESPINERRPLLASYDGRITGFTQPGAESSSVISDGSDDSINAERRKKFLSLPSRRMTFYSFPNTPIPSRSDLAHDSKSTSVTVSVSTSDVEDSDSESGPLHTAKSRSSLPAYHQSLKIIDRKKLERRKKWQIRRVLSAINDFMTPPLWAAAASLTVACIPSLQHLFEHHMQPAERAITAAGKCSIPLTLIVLGAYFYPPPNEERNIPTASARGSLLDNLKSCFGLGCAEESQHKHSPGETKTVIVSIASRMFITPLILLPLMAIGAKTGIHDVFSDPVFVVSNVLLLSSPSALTLAQITQVASGDAFERLISRTIFWSYCIVTPPMTIVYVVIGLILTRL